MKIMIVDDEPLILTGIENIIINEFSGRMEIVKASDGISALDKLKDFTPDLIITDICMPEMTGLELIEKVKESGICNRFIILSGYSDFEYARQAIQYKALDYILKPIDKVELVDLLNNISKNIDEEQEKSIGQELSKIKEIMLYDEEYEENYLNANLVSMIFPFSLFRVILIQIEDNISDTDITVFDDAMSKFSNKYEVFLVHNKKQIVILSNFEQEINEDDLCKELLCLKIRNNVDIKSIGISTVSDEIDLIHTLYDEALRNIYFNKNSLDKSTWEESAYHDIVSILESKSEGEMNEALKAYVENLLSNNHVDAYDLNSLYSMVTSDINLFLQHLGLTLDAVLKENAHLGNEIINIFDDIQLKNQVQKIVAEVWNYLEKKESIDRYSESVSKMLSYINENYKEDISLDDVAETVNLHPNYASSLFKKEIGTSFIQYLNSYRIIKAKDFIKMNTELSLDKIAEMVGYDSSGHFIKVFKKYCNITPGEYRNKINIYLNS